MLLAQWRVHMNRGNEILGFAETVNFLTRRVAISLSKKLYSMALLSSVWTKRRIQIFKGWLFSFFGKETLYICVTNIVFSILLTYLILMFMKCCCNYITATWRDMKEISDRAQFVFLDWSVLWYGNSSSAKSSNVSADPDWNMCYRDCSARRSLRRWVILT
jgi:hypothetical protein